MFASSRVRVLIAAAVLVALCIAPLLAQTIPLVPTVYIPVTHRGDSGPPRPDEQCAAADPGPIPDLNLWITPNPPPQGEFFSVCVRYLSDTQPVVGITGTVLIERFAQGGTLYDPTTIPVATDANGQIAVVTTTGRATAGDRIDIRVSLGPPEHVIVEGTTIFVAGVDAPTPVPTETPIPPPPTPTATPKPACDPSYTTVCIPPPPPDLDCGDIGVNNFTVLPPNPHGFDGDNDGVGCES
jgi:hypothetical protein